MCGRLQVEPARGVVPRLRAAAAPVPPARRGAPAGPLLQQRRHLHQARAACGAAGERPADTCALYLTCLPPRALLAHTDTGQVLWVPLVPAPPHPQCRIERQGAESAPQYRSRIASACGGHRAALRLRCERCPQDHLLPSEYVTVMRENLLDKCPVSPWSEVRRWRPTERLWQACMSRRGA